MSENTKVYEAMFLISQGEAANMNSIVEHINDIFARSDAEVVAMRKWDERRLTYEIDKQRRAVYILSYFRAATGVIARIERDCTLSERIMRVLVLKADHLSDEEIAAEDDRGSLAGVSNAGSSGAKEAADGAADTKKEAPAEAEAEAQADSTQSVAEAPAPEVETADTAEG